jgi:hypothetical protein
MNEVERALITQALKRLEIIDVRGFEPDHMCDECMLKNTVPAQIKILQAALDGDSFLSAIDLSVGIMYNRV